MKRNHPRIPATVHFLVDFASEDMRRSAAKIEEYLQKHVISRVKKLETADFVITDKEDLARQTLPDKWCLFVVESESLIANMPTNVWIFDKHEAFEACHYSNFFIMISEQLDRRVRKQHS